MKKILFTLSFILIGTCGAYAAQLNWGSTRTATILESGAGGSITDYVAYLCIGDATIAQQTSAALATGAGLNLADIAISTKNLTSTSGGGYIAKGTEDISALTSATLTDFYVVLVDATGQNFMVSSVLTATPYLTGTIGTVDVIEWDWDAMDANSGNSGWVAMGSGEVPEPTALALLALGVAGVVLRRRVA